MVPHFEYDTHRGADAVPIRVHDIPQLTSGFTCKLYVNGGGKFMPYHDSSGCKIDIIASYCNLPNQPAAIIKSEIGAKGGRAILTGCHPEFCAFELDSSDSYLQRILDDLKQNETSRKLVFRVLLKLASLKLRSSHL